MYVYLEVLQFVELNCSKVGGIRGYYRSVFSVQENFWVVLPLGEMLPDFLQKIRWCFPGIRACLGFR